MSNYYTRMGLAQSDEKTASSDSDQGLTPSGNGKDRPTFEGRFMEATVKPRPMRAYYSIASLAATPLLVYHGYKRNESIGWAVVWGLVGGGFWVIGLPLAFAQGFAKRKVRSNVRRRRTSRRKR